MNRIILKTALSNFGSSQAVQIFNNSSSTLFSNVELLFFKRSESRVVKQAYFAMF